MNPRAELPRPGAAFVWGVLAILALAVSLFAFHVRQYFVDDAFIGFQYVQNLLAGHGFVFHAGQRPVEGVTNIGWLLALAPPSAVVGPTLAAKAAGLVLLLASLAVMMLLGKSLAARLDRPLSPCGVWEQGEQLSPHCSDRPFGLTLVPTILLASSFEFIYFPLAGMETALLALALLLMACTALRRPYGMALPLLGAFAFLVHPEAVAVYPLYAALSSIRERASRRKLMAGSIVLLAAIGAITAIRFVYFGDVVPNTFHSKPGGIQLAVQNAYRFLMGRNTNVAFPITGWLALPILLLGYWRLRGASPAAADMLAAICGAGLVFAVYSPPDWTALPRYFAPYLPAALILLWSGLEGVATLLAVALGKNGVVAIAENQRPAEDCRAHSAGRWPPAIGRSRLSILAVTAVVLTLTNILDTRTKMSQMETFPGYVLAGKNLVGPAQWMRDHLAADATIATRRIGAVAHYSDHNVFDYTYGLPDPEVARLVAGRGERFDTPTDPALEKVWQARAPEYFLEDGVIMNSVISKAGGVRARFAIHGIEYRVIREFPIGCGATWVLAQRLHAGT